MARSTTKSVLSIRSAAWLVALTSVALGRPGILLAIALPLFVAAAAKSAQLPLHVWLPDAMEGPTPVSALIHAATMVTAGVYLVARAATIFYRRAHRAGGRRGDGGRDGVLRGDHRLRADRHQARARLLDDEPAWLHVHGRGGGGFSSGIFHLMTHAYFKALLFMCAGAVIHALGGEQDMRKMGGLRGRLAGTFWLFLVGGLALAAIFPFSGFWSKDAILGDDLADVRRLPALGWYALYAAGLLTAALTGFYIFRLICRRLPWGLSRRRDCWPWRARCGGHARSAGSARRPAGAAYIEAGPAMLVADAGPGRALACGRRATVCRAGQLIGDSSPSGAIGRG